VTIFANMSMPGAYDYSEVARSVLIAIAASYAALDLTGRVTAAKGRVRVFWLSGGATAMGIGIWAMHFKGMLAFRLPVPVVYHWPTVLASLLVAVFASAVALFVASRRKMGGTEVLIGSVIMGGAIAGMHYVGVAAMRMPAVIRFSPWLVTSSILLAILCSLIALLMAFGLREQTEWTFQRGFGSALVMGVAISAMHYTGMAAASFIPASPPDLSHTVSISPLGNSGVVLATLLVLLAAVITSSSDRRAERKRSEDAARRSEKQLRDLIETIPTMVFSVRPDGSTEFVSQNWQEYAGLSLENTTGAGWQTTIHPDDLETHLIKWRASLANGQPFENEVRHRRANGEYRWFLVRAVPLRDERGNALRWYGILTDIDDRKRAEALLTGEKRILDMVAKGDSLPQILDSLCRLVEEQASGVLASILLVDGDHLRHGGAPSLPKAYTDAIDGAVIGPSAGSCGTAAHRREQVIVEDIATDPLWTDYREAALLNSLRACWSTPIFSSQGKVIATFAMYYREPRSPGPRDQEIIEQITHLAGVAIERKHTQEALRRSEAYLGEAQRLSKIGSWAFSPITRKTHYWSDEMFRIWGFDPQQGPPDLQAVLQRFHPEDLERMRELTERGFEGHLTVDVVADHRIMLPDGTVKYVHGISHPVFDDAGKVIEYIGTAVDVTERKQVEEALRRSEAYLAEAQRLTHTGSWAWDPIADKVLYWSEEMFRIFGLDPQEGIPTGPRFGQRVHAEDHDRVLDHVENSVRQKTDYLVNHKIVLPDGTVRHIETIGHPVLNSSRGLVEYVGTAVDITERKLAEGERERLHQLEADLAHINRVSMMGELAASLAHEIKQPIAAAATNAKTTLRWLQRETPDIGEAREAVSRIVKDVIRAADIIDRNRALYRRDTPKREMVNLNELIPEMIALLRNVANRNSISIRAELDGALPTMTADRVQMQQVLINLMLNGIEAMKETGGELTLRSKKTEDGQIELSVSDMGIGLPAEKIDQLFDAFFTTKAQGTGMGLSISRRIIESHGGRLWASGNPGRGATFHFTVPTEVELAEMPLEKTGS
jgi:PAS domain S-box-containing protein